MTLLGMVGKAIGRQYDKEPKKEYGYFNSSTKNLEFIGVITIS